MLLLINGNSLVELAKLPDNSVDLVVTDPPYGYSFMGKAWDKALPDKRIWKECFRVLKHGGFSYIMSAPRQDVLSRMMINLEDSGFNIGFTSMYWAYATGFPKALNISKAIDKKLGVKRTEVIGSRTRNVKPYDDSNGWNDNNTKGEYEYKKPASEQAKKMDGSYAGFQPKPAVEVIIVCMKPLEEKGYIDQALANGKGVSWFDDCRIPYDMYDETEYIPNRVGYKNGIKHIKNHNGKNPFIQSQKENTDVQEQTFNIQGRYPANLLVSDDSLNDNIEHSSGKIEPHHKINHQNEVYGKYDGIEAEKQVTYGDSGSFSRYFDIDKWWESQFIITPKASKSEKNKGLDDFEEKDKRTMSNYGDQSKHISSDGVNRTKGAGISKMKNNHPTVKPLKLMSYLITLGSREGDVILDPFMGSGTTPLASKQLNRKYIGIELDEDYFKICKARVEDC
jgi:site-specific DNA-methyltransferase (adenine-specific)